MSEVLRFKTWDELAKENPKLCPGVSVYGIPMEDLVWYFTPKILGARVELEFKPTGVRIFAYRSGYQFDHICPSDQFAEFRRVMLTSDTSAHAPEGPLKCHCSWDEVYRNGCKCGGV